MRSIILAFAAIFISLSASAVVQQARWTGTDDSDGSIAHVIAVADAKTGLKLSESDFMLIEDRDMANEHFAMYAEEVGGMPIHGLSIRVWTQIGKKAGALIQAEAFIDSTAKFLEFLQMSQFSVQSLDAGMTAENSLQVARARVQSSDDPNTRGLKMSEQWFKGQPSRIYEFKGKRGTHVVVVGLASRQVTSYEYREFPQKDGDDEFSIDTNVFPIYETVEANHHILSRVPAKLTYIKKSAHRAAGNPYAVMSQGQHYYETMMDPVLGMTDAGRAKGYWSMEYVKAQAALVLKSVPLKDNTFETGGVTLEGRYATVSLHPDAPKKFPGINFTPAYSAQFMPDWEEVTVNGVPNGEMIPTGALLTQPILSAEEAATKPAQYFQDNDPTKLINEGFDAYQVYYAVNTLVDELHNMGFSDPELSTRPFNAFLYNPDISMQDNAFYTDDTINFTTYSPGQPNMARDNSTIWHELGHGVMDRLMGPSIQLADTGGLSEGMADFVAALIIAKVTNGVPFDGSDDFRIINNTGFYLTNEVHDDGEAYGGTMKDLLNAAMAKYGAAGVTKVADLTMETMRLTRNHPGLTATDWFNHVLFADQLGHEGVRAPSELHGMIMAALSGRNFDLNGASVANYSLKNGAQEITSQSPGSRNNPIRLSLAADATAKFHMNVNLKDGSTFKFQYPVELRVYYDKGPLQGAIKWIGKENGPLIIKINSPREQAQFDLGAYGKCEKINRPDGTCVDYAYVQVWNPGATRPAAKKRFYLRIATK